MGISRLEKEGEGEGGPQSVQGNPVINWLRERRKRRGGGPSISQIRGH